MNTRTCLGRPSWKLLLPVVGVLCLVGVAVAATVVSTVTREADGPTTYTYTVVPGAGEQIRDFHLQPANDKGEIVGTPEDPDRQGEPPAPNGPWNGSRSHGDMHWNSGGAGGPTIPAAGMTFKITVPKGRKFKNGIGQWIVTNDGDNNPGDGVVDSGPEGGEPTINVPLAYIAPTGSSAPIGTTTTLGVESSERSKPYVLYVVNTTTGAPDPCEGETAFADWAALHPVPAEWNLTFQGLTGQTDGDGVSNAFRVVVPANPALVGEKFYVVGFIDAEDAGGPERITWWPAAEVTITAP
jgi:hypothetical protein